MLSCALHKLRIHEEDDEAEAHLDNAGFNAARGASGSSDTTGEGGAAAADGHVLGGRVVVMGPRRGKEKGERGKGGK